jgi:hypothetical protein
MIRLPAGMVAQPGPIKLYPYQKGWLTAIADGTEHAPMVGNAGRLGVQLGTASKTDVDRQFDRCPVTPRRLGRKHLEQFTIERYDTGPLWLRRRIVALGSSKLLAATLVRSRSAWRSSLRQTVASISTRRILRPGFPDYRSPAVVRNRCGSFATCGKKADRTASP